MGCLVAQREDRYLRSPRLIRAQSAVELHLRASDGHVESGLFFELDSLANIVGDPDGARVDIEQPSLDEDRACQDGLWHVWIERTESLNTVWCRNKETGQRVRVWEAHATAAAPTFAVVPSGLWVAFHHNLREDTHQPDVAKWIALRFIDEQGRVFRVNAEFTDRDRDRLGEEQSFEFPALEVAECGAVSLVGRGSHQFWRQIVSAEGLSSREPIGEGGWGCRGRRASCILVDEGMLVTWRERKGIRVERISAPKGGMPRLVEAPSRQPTEAPVHATVSKHDFAHRDGRRTLFGDIHQHSAHSDGIGTADEPYLRARYFYQDDFCALTDHESFLGKRIESGEWDYLQRIAESHHEPGSFVTLLAYEWTAKMHPGPGHKVCYFPKQTTQVHSRDRLADGAALIAAVKAEGGFAVPHHVGWTGADEEAHDEQGQPVWEICSCHGCYEHWAHELGQRGDLRDQMVDAVLARGHRFGFIASSDGHGLLWHHGVARKRDPFRTGLTAVQATSCTREAIMDALRQRRCYATSGTKIMLNFAVNESPMGSQTSLEEAHALVEVMGTAALRDVELVDRNGVREVWHPDSDFFQMKVVTTAQNYLYLRVRQVDGEMAWSSPIFAPEDP